MELTCKRKILTKGKQIKKTQTEVNSSYFIGDLVNFTLNSVVTNLIHIPFS